MKTIKLIYKTCILLLMVVCLTACPRSIILRIDSKTKDYCLFDEGSYWIYQDSATMMIDVVTIDKPITYMEDGGVCFGAGTEYCNTSFSSFSQDSTFYFSTMLSSHEVYRDSMPVLLSRRILGIGEVTIYHNGDTINNSTFSGLELLKVKDSCTINGNTYYDVKFFKSSWDEKGYYWAKHVGLIREETYSNDSVVAVRNLVKYHVYPYYIVNELN